MEWVKIKRNQNYSINRLGEVRNDKTGRIKNVYINKENGYKTVDLYCNNQPTKVTLHRLLAEAFIPNPDNKPCIDHKDGNRQNNSISNLRWASYSENNSRFGTIGVRSQKVKVTHFKEVRNKRGGGHLAWGDVDKVLYFDKVQDCAKYFECTIGNIKQMQKLGTIGRRGRTRGYLIEYI